MDRPERDKLPVPEALYPCKSCCGADDPARDPSDLHWFSGEPAGHHAGWYCTDCCDYHRIPSVGPVLADVLAERGAP